MGAAPTMAPTSSSTWPQAPSPFLLNPFMGMQQFFLSNPNFSQHNGNLAWVSDIYVTGGSNVTLALKIPSMRLMEHDMTGRGFQRGRWQPRKVVHGVCDGTLCDMVVPIRCAKWAVWNSIVFRFCIDFATNAPREWLVQL